MAEEETEIEEPEEAPGVPDDEMLHCINPDCRHDDEEFLITVEHQLRRRQDLENETAEADLEDTSIEMIMCAGCKTPVYMKTPGEEFHDPEEMIEQLEKLEKQQADGYKGRGEQNEEPAE